MEIARLCRQNSWSLATWDVDRGLSLAGQSEEAARLMNTADLLTAIKALNGLAAHHPNMVTVSCTISSHDTEGTRPRRDIEVKCRGTSRYGESNSQSHSITVQQNEILAREASDCSDSPDANHG